MNLLLRNRLQLFRRTIEDLKHIQQVLCNIELEDHYVTERVNKLIRLWELAEKTLEEKINETSL